MSASREKKSRQSDPTQGLTQKERKELQEQQAAKRKAVVYTVIGVIVAVLVAALLIWHSGIFQRGKTALTVGGHDYSVTDVNYYFTYYMNQAYSTSGGAFDPSKDLRTQYTDEEQTKSYFDQFLDSTIEQLKKISAVETAASEAGYTLSDDDKAYVDEAISSTKKAAESYGYAYDGYLKAMYGKYMTPSAFKTCVEREALVNGYQSAYADSLGITDEDIQAYYEENASTLDTYDYRYIYLSGKAASTTDEDGNTVEPTEEETKAAMEAAKAKPIIDNVQAGMWLRVQGKMSFDRYDNEMVLQPTAMEKIEAPKRRDTYPEKRVELFDQLMEQYNEDTGESSYPHGYCFTSGTMVTEFEDACKALDTYEVSGVVESKHGYHVILRMPTQGDDLVMSSDGSQQTLRMLVAQEQLGSLLTGWVDEADISWEPKFSSIDYAAVFTPKESFWKRLDVFDWFEK